MPVIEGGHHDERRPCMGNPVKCLRNCMGSNMVKPSSRFPEDLENISTVGVFSLQAIDLVMPFFRVLDLGSFDDMCL